MNTVIKYIIPKYKRDQASSGIYDKTRLIDLCPKCVESVLLWIEDQRRLLSVKPIVK